MVVKQFIDTLFRFAIISSMDMASMSIDLVVKGRQPVIVDDKSFNKLVGMCEALVKMELIARYGWALYSTNPYTLGLNKNVYKQADI